MKKKCELSSCGQSFEPGSNRQKFCSPKCKRKAALLAGGNDVKPATEIVKPKASEWAEKEAERLFW